MFLCSVYAACYSPVHIYCIENIFLLLFENFHYKREYNARYDRKVFGNMIFIFHFFSVNGEKYWIEMVIVLLFFYIFFSVYDYPECTIIEVEVSTSPCVHRIRNNIFVVQLTQKQYANIYFMMEMAYSCGYKRMTAFWMHLWYMQQDIKDSVEIPNGT